MGVRRDAILSTFALGIFLLAFVVANADVAAPYVVFGGVATVAFELLAGYRSAAIRRLWECRHVQAGSLLVAIALAGVGAAIAPDRILSAGIGALVAYLCFLATVVVRRQC